MAALGYAKGKNDCKKGDYGWSQSFEDVKNLWDKYIKMKENPVIVEIVKGKGVVVQQPQGITVIINHPT